MNTEKTLRDEIATLALEIMLKHFVETVSYTDRSYEEKKEAPKVLAKQAWLMADAMMQQRDAATRTCSSAFVDNDGRVA